MKKLLATILTLLILISVCGISALAAEPTEVYVIIANQGELVLTREKVTVTDIDNDNSLTINDALYAAHEAKYEGGASAGYASGQSAWGLSLLKLWGNDSGSFGYTVNNASAMGLTDTVKNGDTVYAYVYKDQTSWSDSFSFFDKETIDAEKGDEVTVILTAAGYDQLWNPITTPVADATITINGQKTTVKTDAEGKATIKLETAGAVVISAVSDSQILVPPVLVANVKGEEPVITPDKTPEKEPDEETKNPQNGDNFNIALMVITLMVSAAALILTTKKTSYEK